MTLTLDQVIAYLEALDAHALADLIDELQRRIGVRPQPLYMTAGGISDTRTDEERWPSPSLVVRLLGHDAGRKLTVVSAVHRHREIPLFEAKRLVESAPLDYHTCDSQHEAATVLAQLRSAGARAVLRGVDYHDVVVLAVPDARRLAVLTALCALRGLSVTEARPLLDDLPAVVLQCDHLPAAEAARDQLADAGADIELRHQREPHA